MNIKGKVKQIGEVEILKNDFKKQKFILDVSRKDQFEDKVYENYIEFVLLKDKTTLLNGIEKGDIVEVNFNIRGNFFEFQEKTMFSQDLIAWKIELLKKTTSNSNII